MCYVGLVYNFKTLSQIKAFHHTRLTHQDKQKQKEVKLKLKQENKAPRVTTTKQIGETQRIKKNPAKIIKSLPPSRPSLQQL